MSFPYALGSNPVVFPRLVTSCHTLKQVEQNPTNNLAPFFKSVFNALVCSVLLTVLHLKTLLLIGCEFSTANQKATNKWFLMATQREKQSTPSERALKTELKTGVRLFVAFC